MHKLLSIMFFWVLFLWYLTYRILLAFFRFFSFMPSMPPFSLYSFTSYSGSVILVSFGSSSVMSLKLVSGRKSLEAVRDDSLEFVSSCVSLTHSNLATKSTKQNVSNCFGLCSYRFIMLSDSMSCELSIS